VREAAAGIFVWPAWGLDDAVQGYVFKHKYSSHDSVPGVIIGARRSAARMA
jgi:hypothetical protein